jgi:hypothetical protein
VEPGRAGHLRPRQPHLQVDDALVEPGELAAGDGRTLDLVEDAEVMVD